MGRARERTNAFAGLAWLLAGTYLPMVLFALAAFLIIRDVVDRGEAAPESTTPPLTAGADYGARRDENIRFFEQRVVETRDSLSYITLAALYLQRFRETGDAGDIGRAARAAEAANTAAPGNYGAMISLASVKLVQHDFEAAADLARDAIARRPTGPDGYAILGDALSALGDYAGAGDAYARVLDAAPGPAAYARQAAFAEVRGNLPLAEQFWRAAIDAEFSNPENAAWSHVQLGNLYFAWGRLDEAAGEFERALVAFDRYPHALAGLARVAASRGDLDRASDLFAAATAAAPLPEYVADYGDVLAALGRTADANRQFALVAAIRELQTANGVDGDLAILQFAVDHEPVTGTLLDHARELYTERPSIEAADTLAWALYRAGRFDDAAAVMAEALRTGARHPRLAFHAAAIAVARGDIDAAAAHLEALESLNPAFSIRYRTEIATVTHSIAEVAR